MKDLSHLPKPERATEGLAPEAKPLFAHLYAVGESRREEKPHAKDTPFRYSDAAACARRLSLQLRGVERKPLDLSAYTNFRMGTHIHDVVQAELGDDGYVHEATSDIDMLTSGSADTIVESTGEVVEYKSVGGYSFKMAIGDRGPAEGPKTAHIIQLALNVMGHDAPGGRIVYYAKEAISEGIAKRKGYSVEQRISAEWTFSREELQPYADKEIARLREVKRLHDEGELAPRHVPYEMPPGTRITDVSKSMWVETNAEGDITDTGTVWGGQYCAYCPFVNVCEEIN